MNKDVESHCYRMIKKYEETHEPWTLEDISIALQAVQESAYLDFPKEQLEKEDLHWVLENMSSVAAYLFKEYMYNTGESPHEYLTKKLYSVLKHLEIKKLGSCLCGIFNLSSGEQPSE
jgi:hypothetical protein